MTLRLSIENMDRLPDGGPIRVEVRSRGLDIGRDSHLDWTLPDPSRYISGKHCEIRFQDGGYWLHDVSTNGTYVNGAQYRVDGPYLLRNGDRLGIGAYIVAVEIEGAPAGARGGAPAPAAASSFPADVWGSVGAVAEPGDRRDYMPPKATPPVVDFLDFASPVTPSGPVSPSFATPSDNWMNLAPPAPKVAPEPPPAPAPQPRRPAAVAPPAQPAPPEPAAFAPAVFTPPPEAPAEGGLDVLARIAAAAGLPERVFAQRDPAALADEIGAALRLTAENLAQLLNARAETKSMMRSSSRTLIAALENNPLKHTTTPQEALAIMFGPPTRSYLDAQSTIRQSFADLKSHQVTTFRAMPMALEALFEDLAPEKIDRAVEPERGIGALVGSRKAKLWDIFVERWRAKSKRSDGRLNEAFAAAFAEAYDRLQGGG